MPTDTQQIFNENVRDHAGLTNSNAGNIHPEKLPGNPGIWIPNFVNSSDKLAYGNLWENTFDRHAGISPAGIV